MDMIRLLILKELKDRLRKRRALSSPQQSVVNYVNYYWLLSAPILNSAKIVVIGKQASPNCID